MPLVTFLNMAILRQTRSKSSMRLSFHPKMRIYWSVSSHTSPYRVKYFIRFIDTGFEDFEQSLVLTILADSSGQPIGQHADHRRFQPPIL